VGDVEAVLHQGEIDLGVKIGKGGAPDPRFAGSGFFRHDDEGLVPLEVEGLLRVALPIGVSRGDVVGGAEAGGGRE
jgi:hypothetical protein